MTPPSSPTVAIQHNVPLAPLTTICLGGDARDFVGCQTPDELHEALGLARDENLRTHILGGGSNVIFSDEGFGGLVIRIETKGVEFLDEGDSVLVSCEAGENWDALVQHCIARGLAGIECLSGIPGSVGATPIQNVGAYGQEVRDTIVRVSAIDRQSLDTVEFSNRDCSFGYRQSRFKSVDIDRYVITAVTFRLPKNGGATIRYPELQKLIASSTDLQRLPAGKPQLDAVRQAVLTLRRRKSMVIDPGDPNSRSVGSFFMNPVLSEEEFSKVHVRWHDSGHDDPIPTFPSGTGIKIPAAWLVEKSGFRKGYSVGAVGVSQNHSLALVNRGGTAKELLELAMKIQEAVRQRFGVHLEKEPVVVPP